jgi:hypothetical protein
MRSIANPNIPIPSVVCNAMLVSGGKFILLDKIQVPMPPDNEMIPVVTIKRQRATKALLRKAISNGLCV